LTETDPRHYAMIFEVAVRELTDIMNLTGEEQQVAMKEHIPIIIKLCTGRGKELRELYKLQEKFKI